MVDGHESEKTNLDAKVQDSSRVVVAVADRKIFALISSASYLNS